MVVENIQRKDLTPFEEGEALQALAQRCGYTHEDLAKRLGKTLVIHDRDAHADVLRVVDDRPSWARAVF